MHSESIAQSKVSLPGVYFSMFKNYPLSNDDISFVLPTPFTHFKDSIPSEQTTCQYLITFPKVNDSLLTESIKYALLSLSFEQKYSNLKKGTEIWSGEIDGFFSVDPTIVGVYRKNDLDSTKVYVLTTYWFSTFEKKTKTNTSKYICESIKFILDKSKK